MHDKYLIRLRVSSSFSLFINKIELDWSEFLDWNETEDSQYNYINSESPIVSPLSRRRKRRRISKKKQVFQLFRIITSIAKLLPSLKIEEVSHKEDIL